MAKKRQGRPQPGEIREAVTPPPELDRLDRAAIRAKQKAQVQRDDEAADRPKPGEQFTATQEGPPDDTAEKERVRRFLDLARERFHLASDATSKLRSDALDDLEFRTGRQWPREIEMQRQIDGRPCLTMNRLPQFIRQVTNEQRQQRPSVQVNPVGDGADTETAEIEQGLIRHIEVQSDAEIAYDHGFDCMVTGGFGYWRVITKVLNPTSGMQEIYIRRVKNPFVIYFDPAATEPDYSDARYCFIIEDMPRSEYIAEYGNTEAATLSDFGSLGDNAAEWATRDTIRVAEYFYVKGGVDDPERKVKWAKINAMEVLDERDWAGKYIPVVPVLGEDLDVNGQRYLAGMVRNAKDPQRMYNYWVSAATELIALAPRAPFVAAEGQIEGHEKEWEQANTRNLSVLTYKPTAIGEKQVPPPQRNTFEPPVQAITLMTRQADLDLKTTTGIYDPTLGQNKEEQSGKAINLLQKQADISNLNWVDNLSRSIRHTGRILLDLIPKIYDSARVQRIIKPDGSTEHVILHNQQPDAAEMLLSKSVRRIYDVGLGTYDVTVSVGPAYQTKRQEAVASQMALVQAYPQAFGIIGDMLVANMDWPGAKDMAKRLKKTLPPQLQDSDPNADPEQQVIQLQSQLAQLMQQHAMLTQTVQKQSQMLNEKQVEAQNKIQITQLQEESRQAVIRMQEATKLAVAQINASKDANQSYADRELEAYSILHQTAHEQALATQQQAHEVTMQENAPQPVNGGAQ
jgi:Phage P22-like portal protein